MSTTMGRIRAISGSVQGTWMAGITLLLAIALGAGIQTGLASDAARALTATVATSTGPATVPGSGTIYADTGSQVAAIDALTGRAGREIPVRKATQSIFLALSPVGDRFFVTDAAWEADRQANYLNIYRTNDWTLERQVAVPDIIRYPGNPPEGGLLPSADGRLLYVSMARGNTDTTSQYWVARLDVGTGTWLPGRLDLPNCGANRLLRGPAGRPLVLCLGSQDLRIIDASGQRVEFVLDVTPVQRRAGPGRTKVAAATAREGRIYVVTENREVHVINLDTSAAPRVLTAAATVEKTVPGETVGVDPQGRFAFVPSGTPEERSHGLASEITVLDATTGTLTRSIRLSGPFRGITFAEDTSVAFAVRVGVDGVGDTLLRLDLVTGKETLLLQRRPLFPGLIVGR